MIEIFALISLTKKIGNLAILKGLKPGTWKLYTVLCWFLAEFTGIFIGFAIFGENGTIPAIILGLGCAITSYFILKSVLEKKPDEIDELEDFGKEIQN